MRNTVNCFLSGGAYRPYMSLPAQEALDAVLEHASVVGKQLHTDDFSHVQPDAALALLASKGFANIDGFTKGCGSLADVIMQLRLIVTYENRRKISAVLSPLPSNVILSLPTETAAVEEPRPAGEANVA